MSPRRQGATLEPFLVVTVGEGGASGTEWVGAGMLQHSCNTQEGPPPGNDAPHVHEMGERRPALGGGQLSESVTYLLLMARGAEFAGVYPPGGAGCAPPGHGQAHQVAGGQQLREPPRGQGANTSAAGAVGSEQPPAVDEERPPGLPIPGPGRRAAAPGPRGAPHGAGLSDPRKPALPTPGESKGPRWLLRGRSSSRRP